MVRPDIENESMIGNKANSDL